MNTSLRDCRPVPDDPKKFRLAVRAVMAVRKADEVRPHKAYQRDPLGWIVEHLEVPEETLRW